MNSLYIVALFVARISALAFEAPAPTAIWGLIKTQQAVGPAPTMPPSMEDLRIRQVQGLMAAPDGTCGYVSGSSGNINHILHRIPLA
jgi:hypothetical protein